MDFERTEFRVSELVEAFKSGSLTRNPEYQRGAAWKKPQKQALIDSIFREYPLPPLFLEVKATPGLGGEITKHYEIIDGQQRILALREYLSDDFELLGSGDPKLRLPLSLRAVSAPWGKRRFSDLSTDHRESFQSHKILVYLVKDVKNSDEVRDLFIRLQSGTALTRQQIRDAWPGDLGPRVERWAGKLTKAPKYSFFLAVDGRGTRDDEDDSNDPYVKHRTTCAQLCRILLERAANPQAAPSVNASDLDSMYHFYTQVNEHNNPFDSIERIFASIQDVVENIVVKKEGRRKVARSTLFALAMYLQDACRSPSFKLTTESKKKLANETANPSANQSSRASSGGVIVEYYERWRASLPPGIGVQLDPKRSFDEMAKKTIRERQSSMCELCGELVHAEDEEYDHFPIPYRDGGRSEPDNGRLVHKECHPRGRPVDA